MTKTILKKKLKQNSPSLVEEATAEALKFVFEKRGKGPVSEKCVKNALGALTKLRGVGLLLRLTLIY